MPLSLAVDIVEIEDLVERGCYLDRGEVRLTRTFSRKRHLV